jgi:hypothetical protein
MVPTTAEIAKGVKGAKGFAAKPALDQMVQLTTNTGLAFGLSVPPYPLSPPANPPMVTITNHLSRFNDVAQKFPKARKVAGNLKKATDGLRDGIKKAGGLIEQGLHDTANSAIDGAADAAISLVGDLFGLFPLPGSPQAQATEHITATRYRTITATVVREVTRKIQNTKMATDHTTVTDVLSTMTIKTMTTTTATTTTTIASSIVLTTYTTVCNAFARPLTPTPATVTTTVRPTYAKSWEEFKYGCDETLPVYCCHHGENVCW